MKINPIFSDNMILQANKPVSIFGTGTGKVTVGIANREVAVVSNNENWVAKLPAFDYGGPYEMSVNLDGEIKRFKDIYFGDVYLLSGQSNIELSLRNTNTPNEYYKDNDSLRMFAVDSDSWKVTASKKKADGVMSEQCIPKDCWLKAQKDTVSLWSALGYLVGDELAKHTDRKIGLIGCFHGASPIQSWLPKHFLDNTDCFVPLEKRSDNARNPNYSAWNGDGMLYDGMLKGIIPFALKAVIWYQGESNANGEDSKREVYAGILKMLIDKWRKDFKDANLPFVVVQIHDYVYFVNNEDGGWRNVQSAQEEVCKTVQHTYLVKCADICETTEIHPASKLELAFRIAEILKGF